MEQDGTQWIAEREKDVRDIVPLIRPPIDTAAINVFTRRDGTIRHFWSNEMGQSTADPGQDIRGVAETYAPLWHMLDTTPEGRGDDWYPSLNYA